MIAGSIGRDDKSESRAPSPTTPEPPTITTGGSPMLRKPSSMATSTNAAARMTDGAEGPLKIDCHRRLLTGLCADGSVGGERRAAGRTELELDGPDPQTISRDLTSTIHTVNRSSSVTRSSNRPRDLAPRRGRVPAITVDQAGVALPRNALPRPRSALSMWRLLNNRYSLYNLYMHFGHNSGALVGVVEPGTLTVLASRIRMPTFTFGGHFAEIRVRSLQVMMFLFWGAGYAGLMAALRLSRRKARPSGRPGECRGPVRRAGAAAREHGPPGRPAHSVAHQLSATYGDRIPPRPVAALDP